LPGEETNWNPASPWVDPVVDPGPEDGGVCACLAPGEGPFMDPDDTGLPEIDGVEI
jgi:hypothetical protein